MSLVLLVEAALFGKSENRNLHADPGYLLPSRYPDELVSCSSDRGPTGV